MHSSLSSLLRLLPLALGALRATAQDQDSEAIWNLITPSSNLTWRTCYTDDFQCARFLVPLDYKQPNGPHGAVALVKVPSLLNSDDKDYRGPILFNPGGPGGSGVDYILALGPLARQIMGSEYDLIGFDPRGVKRTTPKLTVFKTEAEASTFALKLGEDPLLGATPDALGRALARYQTYGTLAAAREHDVAPYVSTPLVARDMLSIVKAHGFDKLAYLGVSYGSVLGMTFASMFPDNVGRIVIDGILDVQDYYSIEWKTNLLDTDKELYEFYKACSRAGPQGCALFDESPSVIEARVNRLLERLKVQPIAASADSSPGSLSYGVVDFSLVKNTLFLYLYFPYNGASVVAAVLAALEQGDASLFWQLTGASGDVTDCSAGVNANVEPLGVEPAVAIQCSDGAPVHDSLEELTAWYDYNANVSSFAGTLRSRVQCRGWSIESVERFTGQIGGNVSSPLLFLSNKFDPITPLANAQTMSKLFPGSGLLVQDAIGHTTFSATSPCIYQAIRAYVRDGILPEPGTVCSVDEELFPTNEPDSSSKDRRRESLSRADQVYREFTRRAQSWSRHGGQLALV